MDWDQPYLLVKERLSVEEGGLLASLFGSEDGLFVTDMDGDKVGVPLNPEYGLPPGPYIARIQISLGFDLVDILAYHGHPTLRPWAYAYGPIEISHEDDEEEFGSEEPLPSLN